MLSRAGAHGLLRFFSIFLYWSHCWNSRKWGWNLVSIAFWNTWMFNLEGALLHREENSQLCFFHISVPSTVSNMLSAKLFLLSTSTPIPCSILSNFNTYTIMLLMRSSLLSPPGQWLTGALANKQALCGKSNTRKLAICLQVQHSTLRVTNSHSYVSEEVKEGTWEASLRPLVLWHSSPMS